MAACLPGIHNLFSPWLYKNRNSMLNSQESSSQTRTLRPSSGTAHKPSASVASHAYSANTTPGYASPNPPLTAPSSPKFNSAHTSVSRYRGDEYDLNPEYDDLDETHGHYNDRINLVGMNRNAGQRTRSSHLVHELSDGVTRWSFVPSHNGG